MRQQKQYDRPDSKRTLRLATAAVHVTRLTSSLPFGTSLTDPVTYAAVICILTTVDLEACHIPARRASQVDPLVALRYQ